MRPALFVLVAGVVIAACATTPTGRRQLELIPDDQMAQLGAESFAQLKQQVPLTEDAAAAGYVDCIARRLLRHAGGDSQDWEIEVFESEQVNAFALPGGKIGVFTGMLRVAENPSQLATVIAHEIAHVHAQHSEARLSEALIAQAGLSVADAFTRGTRANQLALAALGLGAQYGVLMPHSRDQELEADVMGLEYMARAGFDPQESVALWYNMAAAATGPQPPEFLSTHPAHETRIKELTARLPQAEALREQVASRPTCQPPAHLAGAPSTMR